MSINIGKEWRFMDDIEDNTSKLLECWDFASKHHKGQWYGSKPYMYHLKKVSDVALDLKFTDESILMSCLLHDIIEDTEVSYKDVKENFGEEEQEPPSPVTTLKLKVRPAS